MHIDEMLHKGCILKFASVIYAASGLSFRFFSQGPPNSSHGGQSWGLWQAARQEEDQEEEIA